MINYHWIGHCKEGTSDKVWGLIRLTNNGKYPEYDSQDYVAVWGRRGRKLQTKIHKGLWEWQARDLCDKKEDRGYKTISTLEDVYPEFEQDLEQTTVWALLSVQYATRRT